MRYVKNTKKKLEGKEGQTLKIQTSTFERKTTKMRATHVVKKAI